MRVSCCTLTGVDESTDLPTLTALSREFPIVEWGFLYSPKRQGLPGRYPSADSLRRAFTELSPEVRVALHVCGGGVPDLLEGESVVSELVELVAARNGRVQLNFNQTRDPLDLGQLIGFMSRHPALTVITQHNLANYWLWRLLRVAANHAVLFDASGGRGLLPEAWPEPLPGVPCGYAGGLGPENLSEQLTRIQAVAGNAAIWVDMEGRLRTVGADGVDRFDLGRCRACLTSMAEALVAEV